METGSIILILALCLMGGVIAYCADLLGRHLGKKRLKLGRMRPKHTAAFLTTGAGVVIPIVTIGLMTLLFADVRDMLFRTRAIKEELVRVEGALRANETKLDIQNQKVTELEGQQIKLEGEGKKLAASNRETTQRLSQTQQELTQTQQALQDRTRRAAQLQARTEQLRRQNQGLQTRIQETRQLIAQFSGEADEKRQLSERVNRELNDLGKQQTQLLLEIDKAQRSLEEAQAARVAAENQADEAAKRFEQQIATITTDLNRLREEYAQTQQQFEQLQNAGQALVESLGAARTQELIYNIGEEVARWQIAAGASASEAENGLRTLMATASERARRRGAKANNEMSAADFLATRNLPKRVQESNAIRAATSQDDPVVVIARALLNSFAGEPVPVQITVERNTIVYRQGQVIAETRIDGALSERQILDAIGAFLRDRVAAKALADGMIPMVGSDAPLGEVTDDKIVSLMGIIRDYGRPVRVQAIATGETRRADRLELEFRLR